MSEIELKLQVPPERRRAVDAAVAGRSPVPRVRLRAAYFDTADRDLARAGLALRLRREGRRWVQTLKGAADDGLTRSEHNVALLPIESAGLAPGELPAVDATRHAGIETGDRLVALLAALPADALQCLYRTDILRRTRAVRVAGGTVELAYDVGTIVAADARCPVCELEIELVAGTAQVVIDVSRRWAARHRLWLDTRSKAERGDLLARGLSVAPPCRAPAVGLERRMTLADGRRLLVESCLRQIAANASQIASGTSDDEHVHQLRVGLRRLRTLLRLFGDDGLPATAVDPSGEGLADAAAGWFRRLGAARDEAAVLLPMSGRLDLARAQLRGGSATVPLGARPGGDPGAGADMPPLSGDGIEDPASICRSATAQALLFGLHTQVQALRTAEGVLAEPQHTLRDWFAQRLRRWQRRVQRDLARFDTLDADALHSLRIRAKRLRYAAEFATSLYKAGPVRRYLRPLAALQDRLGALNDLTVAIDRFKADADADAGRPSGQGDGQTWFALGWLVSQREAARAACRPAAKAFRATKGFW